MDGLYSYAELYNGRLSFVQHAWAEAADESAAAAQRVIYFNQHAFDIEENGQEYSHKTDK